MNTPANLHAHVGTTAPVYGLSPLWQDLFPGGLLDRLNANPFLTACRQGTAGEKHLRSFLIQHQYYSQYFTRYLCTLMGNLIEQGEFVALSKNLSDEVSGGDRMNTSHVELYRQSMEAMSAKPGSQPILRSTQQLIDAMFRHCRSTDPLDGLAAMCLGAEAIVPIVYGPVLHAMTQMNASEKAKLFFRIHVEEDEQHAIVMREMIDRLVEKQPYLLSRVLAVGEEMVHLRMNMLSELYSHGDAIASHGKTGAPISQSGSPALMPEDALNGLKADTSLGSGNFFDRCLALNPARNAAFLFLDAPVALGDGQSLSAWSLNDLQRIRKALAARYLEADVKRDDVVAVCVEDGISPFLHYLALTSLGAAISLINPAMPGDAGVVYMTENCFDRLIVDPSTLAGSTFVQRWREAAGGGKVIEIALEQLPLDVELPAWWPCQPEDSTLVMISHTSGTTNTSKAVRFEHRQFFMGKRARIGRFAEGADERLLTALPQSHSAAISHLETAVLHGIPTLALSTQDGDAVRRAIKWFTPTTVAAFPQSYMLLVEGGVQRDEFPSVRRWFSMGDAAHQSHTKSLLEGAPGSRFIDAFGSSELGMALFRRESTLDDLAPQRSIGRPVDIAVAKILDTRTGEELPPGRVGLLAVRSPTITSGYWQKPQLTHSCWQGGYFITGDMAFCKEGEFFHVDRQVDVIDTPEGPVYTLPLEEAVQQVPGVCDAAVIGVAPNGSDATRVLAIILLERETTVAVDLIADRAAHALRQELRSQYGGALDQAVAVAVVRSLSFLPVGATGKVLKRNLRDLAPAILRIEHSASDKMQDILYLAKPIPSHLGPRSAAELVAN